MKEGISTYVVKCLRVISTNLTSIFHDTRLLLYAFIPALLREFLKMKTTFSYFQRMFENPAPAVKTSCKRNINLKNLEYYEISTLYECVGKISLIIVCNI